MDFPEWFNLIVIIINEWNPNLDLISITMEGDPDLQPWANLIHYLLNNLGKIPQTKDEQ